MVCRRKIVVNAALVLTGVATCLAALSIAEVSTRLLSDIPMLGSDKRLFTRKYGDGYGLTANEHGRVFGIEVHTDALGFRVSPEEQGRMYDDGARDVLLILGDSVAFGSGVTEEQSLGGILRRQLVDLQVHNAAVPGYDLIDYENALHHLFGRLPNLRAVILVYCLNDISLVGSKELERHLVDAQRFETSSWRERTAIRISRSGFRPVHVWLRSHSKFYLWLRNGVRDQQERYWKVVLHLYGENLDAARLAPLAAIAQRLEEGGVPLLVFVSPYAYQMQHDTPIISVPQSQVGAFLQGHGIEFVDMLPLFRENEDPLGLFLQADPMHLSAKGHRLVARLIREHAI